MPYSDSTAVTNPKAPHRPYPKVTDELFKNPFEKKKKKKKKKKGKKKR